jgi:Na+-translocating ferredoxin:NAD+ oxidoreductase RnfD subunit
MIRFASIKAQLIIFLAGFAIFLSAKDKDVVFLAGLGIAVLSAVSIESVIFYLKSKKFSISESSVISGLIIGYVLSSDSPWWAIISACLLAVISKHFIRFRQRHLFNPAAFGIFLVTVLLGVQTQWKGTYSWHIIVPFGLYFIYRIRRLELLLGYFLASLLLFGIQATQQKVPLSNIFGYLSYFYIFIMMIEPKTTPFKLPGEIIFGICVAVLIFIFTQIGVRFDVELCALLIVNPFVHFLNKIPQRR